MIQLRRSRTTTVHTGGTSTADSAYAALEDQRDALIARYPSIYRRVLAAKRARAKTGAAPIVSERLPLPDRGELAALMLDKAKRRRVSAVETAWLNMRTRGWHSALGTERAAVRRRSA